MPALLPLLYRWNCKLGGGEGTATTQPQGSLVLGGQLLGAVDVGRVAAVDLLGGHQRAGVGELGAEWRVGPGHTEGVSILFL